jgi:oligopeptide transport system substrate-binding protein
MAPAVASVTNDTDAEKVMTLSLQFLPGTQENPEILTARGTHTAKVPEGSQFGYNYTYTAEDMAKGVFDEEEFIGTPETVYIKLTQMAKDEKLDIAKRYELFADAEAFLIDRAIVIPFHQQMESGYTVSKLSVFDAAYAPFGVSAQKYEGQHLLDTPLSMDTYYAQMEEWNAARG